MVTYEAILAKYGAGSPFGGEAFFAATMLADLEELKSRKEVYDRQGIHPRHRRDQGAEAAER
jgi:hypothetical protein